jgi:hypothetical protein
MYVVLMTPQHAGGTDGMEMARTHAAPRPPAPSTPRDYGKPRSSLERPDPENSRPHTCTEIECGMPLPQEL